VKHILLQTTLLHFRFSVLFPTHLSAETLVHFLTRCCTPWSPQFFEHGDHSDQTSYPRNQYSNNYWYFS